MPMEKEGYSEVMESILLKYPNRAALSADETAELMGVDRKTVYAAIHRSRDPLPHKKISKGRVVIPIGKLARWLC